MMNFRFSALLICLTLLTSCKNDDKAFQKSILGTWDVYASNMNDKPNGFMKNGYIVFTDDSLVNSNIFGENQSPSYIVENNRLIIDAEPKFNLEIKRLDQDTMCLEGKLSYYYMEYFLARRKQ